MNKKIIIFIIVILFILFLLNFVFYNKYKMPKGAEITCNNKSFDVYDEDINLYSLISSSNVNILTEDYILDTSSVGKHSVTIAYKYKGFKKYLFIVDYFVEDNINPIFIKAPVASKSYFVNEASNEDLKKLEEKITYADNYDVYPKLTLEDNVNFAKVGTYKITYTITDSSNNSISKTTDIIIKERPKESSNKESNIESEEEEENNTIPFEEHILNYKNNSTMVGIDVSKWQGEVDFEKVKAAGCEFVILRIGVMKDKDSELVKDNTFDINYKNAKKAGLKVGIYVYSEANNVNTAKSNAEFIVKELNGDKLDFPIVFDWESWTYFNSMEMNLHMLNEMYDEFSKTLKDNGYDSMLYASEYYLNNVWMDLKDYNIWIAKYSEKMPEITNGNNTFKMWQNSCTGKIDGINSDVDLDIYYK